jgi:sulfate permease, SulP family
MRITFRPKLLDTLPGYDRAQLLQDGAAGLTVGVLALPLAMAFAIASGLSPAAGIWTAIVAGFIISALGGSRVQIGGPTGAFIPIVYGIVALHGVGNLLGATLLAGLMLIAMGIARLGHLIRFIPVTVVIGFTNGIAVVIFLAQIKDFLGLPIDTLPAEFFARAKVLAAHWHAVDLPTLALAASCLLFLLFYNRLATHISPLRRALGPLAVLVLATLAVWFFELPVQTIGSRFGGIPQGLPSVGFPTLSIHDLGKLIAPALTIALLGAIESLLSARVADGQIGDRHDPNQELIAQGVANVVAPFFGGFAATGAIARTTTNIRSGARTPIAGIVHALVLLAIVLVAAPLASGVPLAALSAIVMVVAIHMGEWHHFATLRRYSWNYRIILLVTFFVTVIFDLTLAVELGMVLASLFFISRMADLTRVERVASEPSWPAQLALWRISGALFFGAVNKLEKLNDATPPPCVVVLDVTRMLSIDTTGLEALATFHAQLKKRGATLLVCGLSEQPASLFIRSGFAAALGETAIFTELNDALAHAITLPQSLPCHKQNTTSRS